MRGIKIVEGRYKKARGRREREEKEQVSPRTKDNCKKDGFKKKEEEERKLELRKFL